MTSGTKRVWFSGLDPVPIPITLESVTSEAAIFAAACMPSSLFIQTVQPYRVHQHTTDTYELVIGPEGFGAVLLEALQWLAMATSAGILGTIAGDRLVAFVQQHLEREKPEWRFEELTEHVATFVADRYARAANDAEYYRALAVKRHDPAFAALIDELQTWVAQER